MKSGCKIAFHPQSPNRAAAGGAGRRLRREISWIFYKNPTYLSPKTPLENRMYLSSYDSFVVFLRILSPIPSQSRGIGSVFQAAFCPHAPRTFFFKGSRNWNFIKIPVSAPSININLMVRTDRKWMKNGTNYCQN